jgi:hypothetical protein
MSTITTKDGVEILHKDWGLKNAQPIVFHGLTNATGAAVADNTNIRGG